MSSGKVKKEEKPPIGLKPRFVWLKMRKIDIEDAMRRYVKANKEVPFEWIKEYLDILSIIRSMKKYMG